MSTRSMVCGLAALATLTSFAQAAVVKYDFEDTNTQSDFTAAASSTAPAPTGGVVLGNYVGSKALTGSLGNFNSIFTFNLPMDSSKKFHFHVDVALSEAAVTNGQNVNFNFRLYNPQTSNDGFGIPWLYIEGQSAPGWVSVDTDANYAGISVTTQTYVGQLQLQYANQAKNGVNNHPNPQTLFIDNLTLTGTEVPEPASLGLLGLGSLALLRRRRA